MAQNPHPQDFGLPAKFNFLEGTGRLALPDFTIIDNLSESDRLLLYNQHVVYHQNLQIMEKLDDLKATMKARGGLNIAENSKRHSMATRCNMNRFTLPGRPESEEDTSPTIDTENRGGQVEETINNSAETFDNNTLLEQHSRNAFKDMIPARHQGREPDAIIMNQGPTYHSSNPDNNQKINNQEITQINPRWVPKGPSNIVSRGDHNNKIDLEAFQESNTLSKYRQESGKLCTVSHLASTSQPDIPGFRTRNNNNSSPDTRLFKPISKPFSEFCKPGSAKLVTVLARPSLGFGSPSFDTSTKKISVLPDVSAKNLKLGSDSMGPGGHSKGSFDFTNETGSESCGRHEKRKRVAPGEDLHQAPFGRKVSDHEWIHGLKMPNITSHTSFTFGTEGRKGGASSKESEGLGSESDSDNDICISDILNRKKRKLVATMYDSDDNDEEEELLYLPDCKLSLKSSQSDQGYEQLTLSPIKGPYPLYVRKDNHGVRISVSLHNDTKSLAVNEITAISRHISSNGNEHIDSVMITVNRGDIYKVMFYSNQDADKFVDTLGCFIKCSVNKSPSLGLEPDKLLKKESIDDPNVQIGVQEKNQSGQLDNPIVVE